MALTPWTADWLKGIFLAGVRLTDDNGQAFVSDLYTHALGRALDWLRENVNVRVPKATVTERHDFQQVAFGEWWMINLDERPVRQVKGSPCKIEFQFGDQPIFECPNEWIQDFEAESGQVQIVPSSGTLATWPLAQFGFFTASMLSQFGKLPGWYKVTYIAGYDTEELPYDLLDLGGKKAAQFVLGIAQKHILGLAGLQSKSKSVDGVSQSLSIGAGGFKPLIDQFQFDIDHDLPVVRRKYHGFQVKVI
jgi:hypothetical protein